MTMKRWIQAILIAPFFAISIAACHGDRTRIPAPTPTEATLQQSQIGLVKDGDFLHANLVMAPQPGMSLLIELESTLHMLDTLLDEHSLGYDDVISLHIYIRPNVGEREMRDFAHAYRRWTGRDWDTQVGPPTQLVSVSSLPLTEARVALDAVVHAPALIDPAE